MNKLVGALWAEVTAKEEAQAEGEEEETVLGIGVLGAEVEEEAQAE